MTKRKFHKTVIQVTILSEEPFYEEWDLEDVRRSIEEGECSGKCEEVSREEVDGKTMAKLLLEQGSDPEFFNLTEAGEDADAY